MAATAFPATPWDVAVVGAGLAGSLTALLLAEHGRRVVLLDRATFPRVKVCGCCLNGSALAALHAVGLGDLPTRLGAVPLHGLRLAAGRRQATIPLPSVPFVGVSLSRWALDTALIAEAQSRGVTFLPGMPVRLDSEENGPTRLLWRGDEPIRARLVIAADGLGGTLAGAAPPQQGSRIGAGVVLPEHPFYTPGQIYMTTGAVGYLGLVRLEDGRLDLACALDREACRRAGGPAPLAEMLLRQAGWPIPQGLHEAAWRGTPPLTRTARRISGYRLFVVGDAAGYVEPFTGEGMAWALRSAVALAPLAAQPWQAEAAQRWRAIHHRVVVSRQGPCRWLASVLRRPWLMAPLVAMLNLWPDLARPFTQALNRPAHAVPMDCS
ncbi:MAG: NAD(P)/FAD-dependent oxidoreductase [Gemmataceae bacterium]